MHYCNKHHDRCDNLKLFQRRHFQSILNSKDQSTRAEEILELTDSTLINGNIPLVRPTLSQPPPLDTATTTTTSTTTITEREPSQHNNVQIVVLMNANARGVSTSTIRLAQEVFGVPSVLVTQTIPDVYHALQNVLQQQQRKSSFDQYNNLVIVTMGGDGTLATTIQTMCQVLLHNGTVVRDHGTSSMVSYTSMISQLPIIAYVPLGTGNAVGSVIGCSYIEPSSSSTTTIMRPIYNVFRRMIPFGARRTESRSLRQLRSTLQHIKDTILQSRSASSSSSSTVSAIPITELPMIEISNANFTDLCFFAGGTSNHTFCFCLQLHSLAL
jgi:hypothetical protein